jgi:hypothetical protein
MIHLLTDHNVNGHIIEGLSRLKPDFDLVRLVDLKMAGADDATVLAWAATNDRIVLSSDRGTMRGPAEARIVADEPMPGLLLIKPGVSIRSVIDSLIEIDACSEHDE